MAANRTKSQKLGSQGQRLVQYLVEKDGSWIIRGQEEDFGIDLEAELDTPVVNGALLKIQVKTRSRFSSGIQIKCHVKRTFLDYANSCRLPVILVIVDPHREQAWYVWLQEWLLKQRHEGIQTEMMPRNVALVVPPENELASGLRTRLRDIAECKTAIQIVLSLTDAIRASVANQSNKLTLAIANVLVEADKTFANFPIELAIGEVLRLGCRIWATGEGNDKSQLLFETCRRFGAGFDAKLVARMVVRGESYSRTGINALGILYDEFPERMRKLGLPKVFGGHTDPRVRYYCLLRERYFKKTSSDIVLTRSDFRIGKWDLEPGIREQLPDKWANRGDSAILDYVTPRLK